MSIKKLTPLLVVVLLFTGCVLTEHFTTSKKKLGYSNLDMGVRYLLGYGVIADDQKAFRYFQKAALDNNVFAQNELAYLYTTGRGTAKNLEKAYQFYELASKRGLASAQYNLALFLMYGLGVKVDKKAAIMWLKRSAQQRFEPAEIVLSELQRAS